MADITFAQTAEQEGFEQKQFGDYIRRSTVLAKAYWHGDSCTQSNPYPDGVEAVDVSAIEQIPTADVRPVVRGKWTRVDYEPCGHDYICSECGCKSDGPWNFCHDCGADMRGTVQ